MGRCCSPGDRLQLEECNRYSLLVDIEGNAWSDRYRLLSHFNTPVLKQASNLTAFFEHIFAPGLVVEQYNHDLADLPVRVAALLQELQQQPARLLRMAGTYRAAVHKACLLPHCKTTVDVCGGTDAGLRA